MHSSHVTEPLWLRTRIPRRVLEWMQFLWTLSPNLTSSYRLRPHVCAPASERQQSPVVHGLRFYVALLVAVALLPFAVPQVHHAVANAPPFPGWPVLDSESALPELPLTDTEVGFARNFPGKIAKFGDSHRSYVMRWVTTPTRRLHSAEDCYRASGFTIHHQSRCPAEVSDGAGCFTAMRNGATLLVQERIIDRDGKTFSDVSAWYWAAMRGVTHGPWWSITKVTAPPPEP